MASEKLTKTQILLALAVGLLLAIAFIALVPADPAPLIYEQF